MTSALPYFSYCRCPSVISPFPSCRFLIPDISPLHPRQYFRIISLDSLMFYQSFNAFSIFVSSRPYSTKSVFLPRSPQDLYSPQDLQQTSRKSSPHIPAKGQQYESLCAKEAGSSPSNAFERRFNTNQSSSYRKLSASWPSRVTSF